MSEHTALPDRHVPSPAEAAETLLPELEAEPLAAELGLQLPDDPEAASRLLLNELMEARQESSRLLEDLQRVAADYANYRKRTDRDQVENVLRASQRVIESLLPTLDSLEAASAYQPQTEGEEMMLGGVRSTLDLLIDTLAKEGLEPVVAAAGTPFDPAVHEAISGSVDGDGDLVVASEVRRGYSLRGRVVRPALVVVRTDADDA